MGYSRELLAFKESQAFNLTTYPSKSKISMIFDGGSFPNYLAVEPALRLHPTVIQGVPNKTEAKLLAFKQYTK